LKELSSAMDLIVLKVKYLGMPTPQEYTCNTKFIQLSCLPDALALDSIVLKVEIISTYISVSPKILDNM
jgi:hypothetical protein